jgi:hypothetical protein
MRALSPYPLNLAKAPGDGEPDQAAEIWLLFPQGCSDQSHLHPSDRNTQDRASSSLLMAGEAITR